VFNKVIMGAVLTAIFIGLAQQMHISEADTRYELCLQEVDRAEWHCRNTGEYPNGTAGPVSVVDPCKTYAQEDRARCATASAAR